MRAPVVVPSPVLFPGRCRTCGGHKGPMVDTQLDDEAGVRLYLCETCVTTMAGLLGLGDVEFYKSRADRLATTLAEAEGELAELAPVRAAVARAAGLEAA